MRLRDCHNFHDFRALAQRRLPGPIFNYIDGAADDERTHRRNTASFDRCDLVPNVLRGAETVDISVTVMGQKLYTSAAEALGSAGAVALKRLDELLTTKGSQKFDQELKMTRTSYKSLT